MKSSGIGGQAVLEGVMMKNKDKYAVAVRRPDHKIEVKIEEYHSVGEKHPIARFPIIRGVIAFIESMVIGTKTLTYSASFYEEEEEEKESKLEKTMGKLFKEKAEAVVMALTIIASIAIAIGIFMILPLFAAEFFSGLTDNIKILALVEGLIRITLFIAYVLMISQMQDIKRVFMYHGAEHKTINCVENGKELTIENVRECSRQHKRCGTSFMFLVMFISVVFFIFLRFDNLWMRMVSRILLVPVIAGVSYEFIRLAGNSDSFLVNFFSKPGLWLQNLTTREPDDAMIEVAIQSVEAVFDWRAYQEGERQRSGKMKLLSKNPIEEASVTKSNDEEDTLDGLFLNQETKETLQKSKQTKSKVVDLKSAREARRARELETSSLERDLQRDSLLDGEEDDEILRALDKFFIYEENKRE
ncbi:DUF1385 domain-containing protein [Velocimicrobium porci]|uniref:DUF1385 domain-containing protein n=1 Tax=Velocimicrobium porci TaxID=2606634 RepID=A0A6L5XZ38_9FIRM|nr:DUF1385 domain-containing protein [Velocimicrobium porci]MSS63817.1 DUF1385 domain-containing protein [Velocimicrobium porci]